MNTLPARRRLAVPGSCLRTIGHGQPLPAVAMMPARRLEACATGSRHGEQLQPGLTQRDMRVMHNPAGTCGDGGIRAA